jgi:hypothetical protein
MHPIFVDIENEFSEIATEAEGLSNRLARLDAEGPLLDVQDRWEATHVCASATEKIYTGCERIMAKLASDIDGAPVSHSDGWHTALLRRMANPYPDLRAAIISTETYALFNTLRSFRHRERNSYGADLDFKILVERSREALSGFSMFRGEVMAFLSYGDDDDDVSDLDAGSAKGPGKR